MKKEIYNVLYGEENIYETTIPKKKELPKPEQ